jgi:mono/diheme cytochrome c family protein
MKWYLVGGATVAAVVGGLAIWVTGAGAAGFLPYQDQAMVDLGRGIYDDTCAACHGARLEGQENWREPDEEGLMRAPPHDDTGHTWHHPDQQLFLITKYGTERLVGGNYRSNMAGFGDILSDDEILAVLAYIKSTWPDRVIAQHNKINENAGN